MMTNKLLAQIHIAKKQLGYDDDTYRDVIFRVTGERSSKDLNDNQRQKLIKEFKRLGFKVSRPNFRKASDKKQVRMIFAIWRSLAEKQVIRNGSRYALKDFVKRMTGIDDPEWLNSKQCNVVIEALKAMEAKGAS